MFGTNSIPVSIPLQTGNYGFGGNGFEDIIALAIIAMIFGWNNGGVFGGGYGGGVMQNYVLGSDFATLQRQMSDGFNSVDNALDRQNTGICDLGYTQLSLNNQTNMSMMQGFNALQSQLAQCCCDNKQAIAETNYNIATQACAINTANANNTRDIIDNDNANTRAILEKLNQQEVNALNDKIACLTADNQALRFNASQQMQNAYLINKLQPTPIPSFPAQNLYGYYGTTIA